MKNSFKAMNILFKKERKDIFIISIVCFIFAITLISMYKVQKQQKYENNYNNIIQRLCSDYYVGDQLALAYREPASLVVMYSGGLTQKKVIQFCDYLNINLINHLTHVHSMVRIN